MIIILFNIFSGNAFLYDLNIKEHMDEIRTFLGVCPQVGKSIIDIIISLLHHLLHLLQHDILWADLTAREHMQIFSQLKGVPKALRNDEINTLLANVQLDSVRITILCLFFQFPKCF